MARIEFRNCWACGSRKPADALGKMIKTEPPREYGGNTGCYKPGDGKRHWLCQTCIEDSELDDEPQKGIMPVRIPYRVLASAVVEFELTKPERNK